MWANNFHFSNLLIFPRREGVLNRPPNCDKLKKNGVLEKAETEFYFLRYIIWYLLFAGRKSSYAAISVELDNEFEWLSVRFPQFLKNKNISLFRPAGETLKNRVIILVFIGLYRLKVIKLFLRFYAKSD